MKYGQGKSSIFRTGWEWTNTGGAGEVLVTGRPKRGYSKEGLLSNPIITASFSSS